MLCYHRKIWNRKEHSNWYQAQKGEPAKVQVRGQGNGNEEDNKSDEAMQGHTAGRGSLRLVSTETSRPISGPLLKEKALQLNEKLDENADFHANEGWKWQFCRRYGIHQLSVQGEKLPGNDQSTKEFIPEFRRYVCDKNLTLNQIFTCDETGLNFAFSPTAHSQPASKRTLMVGRSLRIMSLRICAQMHQAL